MIYEIPPEYQFAGLALMPFLSGAIGWFTNFIAVKMLLKPLHPVKFLGLTIQGLLPRRHEQLASRISSSIARDFLTPDTIVSFINQADTQNILKGYLKNKWDENIGQILGGIPMLEMFLPPEKLQDIRDRVIDSFTMDTNSFNGLLVEALTGEVDLEGVIRKNILAFDLAKLEEIIEEIARREFRYIERLGGLIGFIIGLAQAAAVWAFF